MQPTNTNNTQQQQQQGSMSSSFSTAAYFLQDRQEKFDVKKFENVSYPYCSDVSKFVNFHKIGQGTFGEVYKTNQKEDLTKVFALKKILTDNEKEGFPITALREINILMQLRNENVVKLIEVSSSKPSASNNYKSQFYLVFEFCDHDLAGLLSNPHVKFQLGEIKTIMKQLLNGLYYIHKNHFLHRDMKTANILVTKEGVLKLADFGLARAIDTQLNRKMTNRVVTLWYRPPELLLGERNYTSAIDMWGAGCIMAELWTRSPIMQGNNEQHQIMLITQLCGSIDTTVWPNVDKFELYKKLQLPQGQKRRVKERIQPYVKDQYALDLIDKLLALDPSKRLDSDEALDCDFFWTEPMPSQLLIDKHLHSQYEMNAPPRVPMHMRPPPQQQQQQRPVVNQQQHYDRVY